LNLLDGCITAEFDSTYPIDLIGIISEVEFRQSINRINHEISSNKILRTLIISSTGLIIMGSILLVVLNHWITPSNVNRSALFIAQESKKYSSRSPIPCSWRLGTTADYSLISGNLNNNQLANYVSIIQSLFYFYFK
jgi:hypothetical protein